MILYGFVPLELTVVEVITTLRGETRKTKHYFYREANNLYPSNDFMESFPEIKYEGEGRVLFIDMGQAFHYLPDFKERKELYAERDGEWFKVAHNFWKLGEGCKITIPKYFL